MVDLFATGMKEKVIETDKEKLADIVLRYILV